MNARNMAIVGMWKMELQPNKNDDILLFSSCFGFTDALLKLRITLYAKFTITCS
jgi:hypothetical protein